MRIAKCVAAVEQLALDSGSVGLRGAAAKILDGKRRHVRQPL